MRRILWFIPFVFVFVGFAPNEEITEITLQRTPCFGACPTDRVVLHPDGNADYYGQRHVQRVGHYKGIFGEANFDRLSKLIVAQRFFDLKPRYHRGVTDLPSVIVTVKRGDKVTEVNDNGHAGPLELWGIEMAITGVLAEVAWEKAE
ncbi:DUF6438 domain-containing protein [Singulisphaera sp. PoT]|uniref:DUF6438 domain-containing protein n=1 Tax=Singulisphaera sp. PoT TaxID=3411797 RepID=UPI003BF4ADE3